MTLPDLDDLTPDELRALTDTDLQHLLGEVYAEVQRRATLAAAPAEAEALAARYAEAIGREDGDEWQAPSGAHDAYMTGDRVTYQGAIYESLMGGNVWSPDAHPAGWKKI